MSEGRIASLRVAFEGKTTGTPPSPNASRTNGVVPATHRGGEKNLGDERLPESGRPDTPQYGKPVGADTTPQAEWENTIQSLERAATSGTNTTAGITNGPLGGRDRNLSGIVSATSKALKAALMENEELQLRNTELEACMSRQDLGSTADTDAGEIERALYDASLALAARRQDILALEHQVLTLQAENSVLLETQTHLKSAVTSHVADEVCAQRVIHPHSPLIWQCLLEDCMYTRLNKFLSPSHVWSFATTTRGPQLSA